MTEAMQQALGEAVEKAGGNTALAEALSKLYPDDPLRKITPQAISQWKKGKIPPERVLDVERITGVSRHLLRPDLYGEATV